MRRLLTNVGMVAMIAGGLFVAGPAAAQAVSSASSEAPRERAYYERIIGKIEPKLVGSPERLPLYIQFFQREMINDLRLFPFHVEAEWTEEGQVLLRGFVGYRENRAALLRFLRYLGFERVDDRLEVLPSKKLGRHKFAFIKASHSFSFDQPTGRREVLTDCLLGSPVLLLREAAEGFFLCQGVEGYVGYIDGRDIQRVDRREFARYQTGSQVRVRRDFRTPSDFLVPTGARLKYVGRRGEDVIARLPSGDQTNIPADCCEVLDGAPSVRLNRVIENAESMLGTKYVWGGNTSEGLDCSGLMQTAFAAEGIHVPRDSNQQIYLGSLTATRWYRDGLRRGDTLYFLGENGKISHTAIYVGDGRYLEAVRPVVRYTSFHPEDEEYHERRAAAFCFAKRLME